MLNNPLSLSRSNPFSREEHGAWDVERSLPGGDQHLRLADNNRRQPHHLLRQGKDPFIADTIFFETEKTVSAFDKIICETQKMFSVTEKIVSDLDKMICEAEKIFSVTEKMVSVFDKIICEADKIFSVTDKIFSTTEKILSEPSQLLSLLRLARRSILYMVFVTEKIFSATEKIFSTTETIFSVPLTIFSVA